MRSCRSQVVDDGYVRKLCRVTPFIRHDPCVLVKSQLENSFRDLLEPFDMDSPLLFGNDGGSVVAAKPVAILPLEHSSVLL